MATTLGIDESLIDVSFTQGDSNNALVVFTIQDTSAYSILTATNFISSLNSYLVLVSGLNSYLGLTGKKKQKASKIRVLGGVKILVLVRNHVFF